MKSNLICARSPNLTVVGRREMLNIQQLKEKVNTAPSARINTCVLCPFDRFLPLWLQNIKQHGLLR